MSEEGPVPAEEASKALSGRERRALKHRGKTLPVGLRVGKRGLTANVLAELKGHLAKDDLIKLALSGDRSARSNLIGEIEEQTGLLVIAKTGSTVVFHRPAT